MATQNYTWRNFWLLNSKALHEPYQRYKHAGLGQQWNDDVGKGGESGGGVEGVILNSEYLKKLRNKTKARKNKYVQGFRKIAIEYHNMSSYKVYEQMLSHHHRHKTSL